MAGLAGLTDLRRLMLRDTLITDDGLKYLQRFDGSRRTGPLRDAHHRPREFDISADLKSLRRLNLLGAQATDESMNVLSGMPSLEVVNLYRTRVTNSGLPRLQSLKKLTDVDVRYSRVTPNGVEALRAALPAVKVRFDGASPPKTKSAGAARPADSSRTGNCLLGEGRWAEPRN